MSLMQEILDKIEADAAAASAMALQSHGLICEAEALRDTLRQQGLTDVEPRFIDTDPVSIVFYLSFHPHTPAAVRRALAGADIVIAAETPRGNSVELTLAGLDCVIWIAAEQPLALAA